MNAPREITLQLHPLCTLFPRMEGAEFAALVEDIRANGLRQPIVLHEGMILDGGNRYRACLEAGVTPSFAEFDGGSVVSFVLSANLHRRHMTPGQQAAIVASAQDWAKQAASGSNQHRAAGEGGQDCPPSDLGTRAKRAAVSGASERTQKMADKVAKASPDLAKQVAHGEKTLPEALEELTGKRPGKRTKTAPVVVEEPVAMDMDDLPSIEEQFAEMQHEIDRLNAKVSALLADDTKAELAKQVEIRQGIEGRLADEQRKNHELRKELNGYGKWYAELRKITGLESRAEITRLVREAKEGARA